MNDRDEYAVRVVDLPTDVGGFITESPDGFRNIYINARHGWTGQRKSFRHELRHAEHDDLRSDEPLEVIEARADGDDIRVKTLPHLMRARDLLPPPPKPEPPKLTPRQLAVIRSALADLDNFCLSTDYNY